MKSRHWRHGEKNITTGQVTFYDSYRVALIAQILSHTKCTDLAQKSVKQPRKWAQDSLLVNIAESWSGLRVVCPSFPQGGKRYQSAFYAFEEIISTPGATGVDKRYPFVRGAGGKGGKGV